MSLLDAQRWLDRRPDIEQPLYAVMVQYENGDATEYQLINTGIFGIFPTPLINHAVWKGYSATLATAKQLIRKTIFTEKDVAEVTRAFIVKKDTECQVIEEVKIDGPEAHSPRS